MRIIIEFDSEHKPEIKFSETTDQNTPGAASSSTGSSVNAGIAKTSDQSPAASISTLAPGEISSPNISFDRNTAESAGPAPTN